MEEEVAMFGPSDMFFLLSFLPFIFYLILIVFGIYFVIKVIKFMKAKIELDRERNLKLEELIKIFSQNNHIE